MAKKVNPYKSRQFTFYWVVIIVFLANATGILPATLRKWNFRTSNPSVSFKFNKYGLLFISVQLGLISKMAFQAYSDLSYIIKKPNPLLLQVICMMILTNLKNIILNFYCLSFGMRNMIKCLNITSTVLMNCSENTKSTIVLTAIVQLFFLIFGSLPLYLRLCAGGELQRVLSFLITNFQEIMIAILLTTLLTVAQTSLKDINVRIKSLKTCSETSRTVELLMLRHSQIYELINILSVSFGFTIVLLCYYSISKVVLLIYYSYFLLVSTSNVSFDHLVTAVEVPYRCLTIWYLGYKCDQITHQKAETQRLLAQQLIWKYTSLEKGVRDMMFVFQLQMLSRSYQFSACGLFKFTSSTFYGMLQMTITYIVVLIQFHTFM